MSEFAREGGTGLFMSHDLGAVARICERLIWIEEDRSNTMGQPPEASSATWTLGERAASVEFPPDRANRFQLLSVEIVDSSGQAATGAAPRDNTVIIRTRLAVREQLRGLNLEVYLVTRRGVRVVEEASRTKGTAGTFGEWRRRSRFPRCSRQVITSSVLRCNRPTSASSTRRSDFSTLAAARGGANLWSATGSYRRPSLAHGADGCPGKPTRDRSPSVSVIVPTVGRPRLLQAALESLAACSPRGRDDRRRPEPARRRSRNRRPVRAFLASARSACPFATSRSPTSTCSRRETRSFS